MTDPRFQNAIARFAAVNAQDPTLVEVEGARVPRELAQAARLVAWVEKLEASPSEPLRLAAHCQHIGRFLVPRTSYPNDRTGYLKWRSDLGKFHAEKVVTILKDVGYDEETIERVRRIVRKQGLSTDPDVQTMEDALCLAFLEHEFGEFVEKHDDEKLTDIVLKTWRKMSEKAHEHALALPLSGRSRAIVERALSKGASARA